MLQCPRWNNLTFCNHCCLTFFLFGAALLDSLSRTMIVSALKSQLEIFRSEVIQYRDLWGESLEQPLPDYRVKNFNYALTPISSDPDSSPTIPLLACPSR